MEDLEPFYPDRMAGRILGMGDVLSFVEKAQEVVSIYFIPYLFYLCLSSDYKFYKQFMLHSVIESLQCR